MTLLRKRIREFSEKIEEKAEERKSKNGQSTNDKKPRRK